MKQRTKPWIAFHLVVFTIIFLLYASIFVFNGIGTVTSDSMAPNIQTGDVVVLSDTDPLAPIFDPKVHAQLNGNTTVQKFNQHGSVIAFKSNVSETPVVHRVFYRVDKGENWIDGINTYTGPSYTIEPGVCQKIKHCPAPHSGYITKGDNNTLPDQLQGMEIINKSNIIGVAHFRIPSIGTPLVGYYHEKPTQN